MEQTRFRLTGLFLILFLASGTTSTVAQERERPGLAPGCAANTSFSVIDVSFPIDVVKAPSGKSAFAELKAFGVDTIFRYYDLPNETLRGKTLTPAESDAIIRAGMKIGVVFQHNNDDPVKFMDPAAGATDAKRALFLADQNKQPFESAIYFGIDGPEMHLTPLIREYRRNQGQPMPVERQEELRRMKRGKLVRSYEAFLSLGHKAFNVRDLGQVTPNMMRPLIKKYFEAISAQFSQYKSRNGGNGYKIGMYCTAAMCSFGEQNRLAEYFWLSPEGRDEPIYDDYLKSSSRLNLVQHLPTKCDGWHQVPDNQKFEFDFNQINPERRDFGQWQTKRAR